MVCRMGSRPYAAVGHCSLTLSPQICEAEGVRAKLFGTNNLEKTLSDLGGPGDAGSHQALPGGPGGAPGGRLSAPTAMDGSDGNPRGG